MAKKARSKKAERALATVAEASPAAVRHTFSSGGLLGHDLTASPWLVNVSEQTALALDVVQDCVQVISDAVAGSEVGQWNGLQRIEPPSTFTLRPDPDMTRHDFLWLMTANLALYRAVYFEEATFDGSVIAVRIHCIANVMKQGRDYYVGGKKVQNNMRLIRRSIWPTLDPESGSTIQLAREVFAGAMSANAYASDYWQQGGNPAIVLRTESNISGTQADEIADRWVEKRTTSPGRPAVLGNGADVKELGANLGTEGANISADKLRASIARYFSMPPGIVNVLSEAGPLTYSTEEQESIRLYKHTIKPYCDVESEALSSYLPGDYLLGDRIVIDASWMTRADQVARFTAWESALRAGWMTKDEVRAMEGLAPDESLNEAPAPVSVGGGMNVGA